MFWDSAHGLLEQERSIVKKIVGIILVLLGLAGLAWGGFTYTTREKVVDIGPIHASVEKTHNVPLPPLAGGRFDRRRCATRGIRRTAEVLRI